MTASFLLLIDYRAAAFFGNQLHRRFELLPAIAFNRAENVSGQTLRMNADEHRTFGLKNSACQYDKLFIRNKRTITDNPKLPEFCRQLRFGCALDGFN